MPTRVRGSKSYYKHKYRAFGAEVLRAPFMRRQMLDRAYAILQAAQALAPVETGEYLDSFEVDNGIRQTGRSRRAYARVSNTAPHAMAVEFGFGATPRYRVLGHALGVVPGHQKAGG